MPLSHKLGLQGPREHGNTLPLGILAGEGIGPEVITACTPLFDAIEANTPYRFDTEYGGSIGNVALAESGAALTTEVINFCQRNFLRGAPLFCGPGGQRFVYELRREFDIFCKFVPLRPLPALRDTGALRPEAVRAVDILLLRENLGGVYQGIWRTEQTDQGQRAHQSFFYDEAQVRRIMSLAVTAAASRRNSLCVVHKPGGAPAISDLWVRIAIEEVAGTDVDLRFLEVDTAAYLILAQARDFDVVVTPNLFGDILADAAALLLGSRGMSYSFNLAGDGIAVYQTGHGAAYDLAGTGRANPLGQIQSLAALLEESYGLGHLSRTLVEACNSVLSAGIRTADIAVPGSRVVATEVMGEAVGDEFRRLLAAEPRAHISAG